MPSPPSDDPTATDCCAGFDLARLPLLNVLKDARDRGKAARLAISARDIVTVTAAGVGLGMAAQWLNVDEDVLVARIQGLTPGEWGYIRRAILAAT